MAKIIRQDRQEYVERVAVQKKTSIGNSSNLSKCMMNKSKRRGYKKYRGQGK
jgi:hypothetical protein